MGALQTLGVFRFRRRGIPATERAPASIRSSTIPSLLEESSASGTAKGFASPAPAWRSLLRTACCPVSVTDKSQGQANFGNPGIFILNAGADFDLTPKLKALPNVNFLRFEKTAPIELLLFESPIHTTIGLDYSLGFQYRPPLSENMSITGGASALSPGQGFRDIYSGKTQFSLFTNVRFQF